jgi:hypothetical protein
MNNSKQIKHLYARAGFGIRFEDLHDKQNWSIKKSVAFNCCYRKYRHKTTVL